MAIITEPGRSYDGDKGFFLISLMMQVFTSAVLRNEIVGSGTGSYPLLIHGFMHQE